MLTELASLANAASAATSNVLAGGAARRTHPVVVLVISATVALLFVTTAAVTLGGTPGPSSLALGATAGLLGGGVLPLAYRAFALGPIGVVTPLISCVATILVTVVAVVMGSRPGAVAVVGLALCLAAVVMVSLPGRRVAVSGRALVYSVVVGVGFGLFTLLMSGVPSEAGLWPLACARLSVLAVAAVAVVSLRRALVRPGRRTGALAAGSGISEVAANLLLVTALATGDVVMVATLISVSPVFAALIARIAWGERLVALQWCGLTAAVVGTVLVAL